MSVDKFIHGDIFIFVFIKRNQPCLDRNEILFFDKSAQYSSFRIIRQKSVVGIRAYLRQDFINLTGNFDFNPIMRLFAILNELVYRDENQGEWNDYYKESFIQPIKNSLYEKSDGEIYQGNDRQQQAFE